MDSRVSVGESGTVNCAAEGNPTPTVEWYIDGKPFKGTIHVKLVVYRSVNIYSLNVIISIERIPKIFMNFLCALKEKNKMILGFKIMSWKCMCYFMVKMGYYKGINHSDYQSSYPRESSEFRLCQGQVHLVNHCKVEDHNSRNITGAYCDIRL